MKILDGKVAIITGASSGIGRATAKLFAAQGARLVVTARRKASLDELTAEIENNGGKAVAIAGDIRDEALVKTLAEIATSHFGGLDIAFNNAGMTSEMAPAPDISSQGWRTTIDTNLTSAFLCAKYQIPALIGRGGGSLIFTSSFVGYSAGFPGMTAYAASKVGLIGMMQVIASEFGAQGIRANAILPGGTVTPMNAEVVKSPEILSFVKGMHGLKRLAQPEEIAQSVLHLASDASSFMTGTAMLVDGGVSIYRG